MSVAPVAARPVQALRAAVASVDCRGGATVAVAGRCVKLGDRAAVDELATLLYVAWFSGSLEPEEPFAAGGSRDLTEALRAAHAGTRRFSRGWRARRVSSVGRVVAERDGELRLLGSADYVAAGRPGLAPRVGHEITATERRDSLEASPGYWLTTHPRWPDKESLPPLVRIYWNAAAGDAPALVNALTAALLDAPEPWALKLPVDAALHARRDAAVLYLARAHYAALAPAIAAAAAGLRDVLVAEEPPLTLRLAPGVGLAEDPGGDHSFGTSRCLLVAEGIAAAVRSGEHGEGAMLAAVIARMRGAGLDPERPQLEPGSEQAYAWPERAARSRATAPTRWAAARRTSAAERVPAFREAALAIAHRLAGSAIWNEDRCTWLGEAIEPAGAGWTVVTRTCDGGLYGGTAGVGRFLTLAGERETARGALRHALATVRREPLHGGGLWLGPLGPARAALEAAGTLDDPELREAGTDLALRAAAAIAAEPAGEHDLLGGDAGAILGLLAVERALGGDRADLLAAATAAARRLLDSASPDGLGVHWPGAAAASPYGLCGLAHGASGIALALLALHERAGDPRHREAAAAALAYERRWFRGEAGGWPDLRDATVADLRAARNISYPALWCHGAVGIGLVRLTAYAWGGQTADLAEAGAAIHAARTASAGTLGRLAEEPDQPGPAANWSLCHGLLGAAELMLCAAEVLAEPAHLAAARRLGERALADRAVLGAWRCGVDGAGETPGLMLGLAGIGTTLLRLDDPGCAPSPALPGL